jgi:hypothetical protein
MISCMEIEKITAAASEVNARGRAIRWRFNSTGGGQRLVQRLGGGVQGKLFRHRIITETERQVKGDDKPAFRTVILPRSPGADTFLRLWMFSLSRFGVWRAD